MNNVDYMTMFTKLGVISVFAPTSIVLLYLVITENNNWNSQTADVTWTTNSATY